jgi:DNA polymerase III alpha subunit
MRLDQFNNPVFNDKDLFNALYKGYSLSPDMIVETSSETQELEKQLGYSFLQPYPDNFDIDLAQYDSALQSDWFMPDEYKQLDIEAWVREQSPPWDPIFTRVEEELAAFKERNMLDLLRWLKYFVDTMRSNNLVWGVGRGSSVASYVLYVIGVHKIDSIKYNLDWQEFLR